MAGRRQKPRDQLQDQRPSRTRSAPAVPSHLRDDELPSGSSVVGGEVVEPGAFAFDIPPAPKGLLPETAENWKILWSSPLREFLLRLDMLIIYRYFDALDENARAWSNYRRKKVTVGSKGQPVISPWWWVVKDTESMCERMENMLGIGPLARMRLNISFAEAVTKLAEAYALAVGPNRDGQPGEMVADDDEESDEPGQRRR